MLCPSVSRCARLLGVRGQTTGLAGLDGDVILFVLILSDPLITAHGELNRR